MVVHSLKSNNISQWLFPVYYFLIYLLLNCYFLFASQYSIGVDGKEAKAGAEPLNTPVKILLDNYSDLDIHIGQGSNLFVKEHTIHFSHAMIFKGW